MPLSNASRLADFGTGIGTAGAIIQVDNANQRLGVGTTAPTATLGVAGIVSATAFYGDGSNLDGVASAGLGTALSEEEFNPLTVIYQTSDTLSVGATITVDPPDATTKVAYTQYAEILLQDDADLIVADGDDFIPDILGLSSEGFSFSNTNGNGVFDTVYTDNIENAAGRGAPNFPLGITVTGISTLSGNVSIGGTLTYEDVTNVDSIGLITARSGIRIGAPGANTLISGTGSGIGIGTNSPLSELHVMQSKSGGSSHASSQLTLERDGTNYLQFMTANNGTSGLLFGDVADNDGTKIKYDHNISTMLFETEASERLRIGPAGQIGLAGANYGTSGQVMTSQGGSAAPQWADASGGAWNLLSTTTITSSTEIEIAIPQDAAYDEYAIRYINVGYQAGSAFRCRAKIKIDGSLVTGSNYAHGAYGKYVFAGGNPAGGGSTGSTHCEDFFAFNNDVYGVSGTLFIAQPTGNVYDKGVYMPQMYGNGETGSSGSASAWNGTGTIEVKNTKTNNLTHFIFYSSTGVAWDTGKVKLYGIS